MKLRTRLLLVLLAVVVAGTVTVVVWPEIGVPPASEPVGIPSSGGTPAWVALSNGTLYLQDDPEWGSDPIGGSGETIASVGCTICCLSMALAEHGFDFPPGRLNERLVAENGYTEKGWVKWRKIPVITGGRVNVEIPEQPSFDVIDSALTAGAPVIVKVEMPGSLSHWVVIVGKEGIDYVIKDPLGTGRNMDYLKKYPSGIKAVRVIRLQRSDG